jgi:hypothetical protein
MAGPPPRRPEAPPDGVDRAAIARLGGYSLSAKHDPREYTAKARTTFLRRFEDEVDPDRKLPEPERLRRAEAARKAYFVKLALRSAQARRKRAAS